MEKEQCIVCESTDEDLVESKLAKILGIDDMKICKVCKMRIEGDDDVL